MLDKWNTPINRNDKKCDLSASTPQIFTRTPQISTSASQISAPTPHMFSSATDSLPLQTDQYRSTPARDVTQQDLAIGFAGLTRRMMLPSSTPIKFSGDIIDEYITFISSFDNLIATHCSSDQEKYNYLLQFTEGEALKLVSSCYSNDPSASYREARITLDKEYGDPYELARHHSEVLRTWPNVKINDGSALRDLALYLTRIKNIMSRGREFSQFNHPTEIKVIVDKLPQFAVNKWRERDFKIRQEKGEITFDDLTCFVKELSGIVNQPIFGSSQKETLSVVKRPCKEILHKRTFATDIKENCVKYEFRAVSNGSVSSVDAEDLDFSLRCWFCKSDGHLFGYCREFGKLSLVLRGRARLSSVVLVATWTLYLRNLTTFVKFWSVNFCRNCIVCKVFNVFFYCSKFILV